MSTMRVLASGLEFPEGPVALPDGSVVLVELRGKRLTRVHADGRRETVAEMPGSPNGAAVGPDGKIYVCNSGGFSYRNGMSVALRPEDYIGSTLQRVDLQSGRVETLLDRAGDMPFKGLNDLVFDRAGGLWFTDLGKRREQGVDYGAFYYAAPGIRDAVVVASNIPPANGIGLSPDERTVYVAETPGARLWSHEISGPGQIAPVENLYRAERGICLASSPGGHYQNFDSLAVEACGNICVATLIKGGITVIAPDGRLVEHVDTGDHVTTNIAFGGPELKTAYITLSHKGQLVAMDWPRPGLPLNFLNK